MNKTAKKIFEIQERLGWKDADLCIFLGVSKHTLKAWRLPETSKAARNAPAHRLDLLQFATSGQSKLLK